MITQKKVASVLMCGTFDPSFGRNRQLKRLVESQNIAITTKSFSLWSSNKVTDIQIGRIRRVLRATAVYPKMIIAVCSMLLHPQHRPDVLLVPHPCQFDAIVIGVIGRIVRVPVVIDYFVSLHETVVEDRLLVSKTSIAAKILRWVDVLSAKLATVNITDTPEDAQAFASSTSTSLSKWRTVWVGADPSIYVPLPHVNIQDNLIIFYGTYIPLQGIEDIVHASLLLPSKYQVCLIGDGQERPQIEKLINELGAPIKLLGYMSETELAVKIAEATICLGIFGTGAKTSRVIPNKVFQCMAMGKAIITADTPAIRNNLKNVVVTVTPGNPAELAQAVISLNTDDIRRSQIAQDARQQYLEKFSDAEVAPLLIEALQFALC